MRDYTWQEWKEWFADMRLWWQDPKAYFAKQCSKGYHALVFHWIDEHHALTTCLYCPYQGKEESWGE